MEQNENTLSVLKIAPGQHPQQVEIDNDLKALQQAVGGSIGASYPFADPVAIICNDEGKLMGLPLNRALRDENGQMYDAVAGDFLVVGLGEEDFASLTPELAQKYEQLFHQPEAFLKLGKASGKVCQRRRRCGRCSPRCKRGNPDRAHQGNGCRNHRLGKNAKGRNSCCSCRIAEAKAGTPAPKSRNRFFKTNAF